MKALKQQVLNLCLKDEASFSNFFTSGDNVQLVETLKASVDAAGPNFIYFWGRKGSGKTHLLSALCQLFDHRENLVAYLPLEDLRELGAQVLDDLEGMDLVVVDDLHLIAGDLEWEEGFFHCFNKIIASNKRLIISSEVAPQELLLKLPDLKSRMTSGLVFLLKSLDDMEKSSALKLRAKLRGLELTDPVANFLLNHYCRDSKSLFLALSRLDQASLLAQRKLTIPFVKEVLGMGG